MNTEQLIRTMTPPDPPPTADQRAIDAEIAAVLELEYEVMRQDLEHLDDLHSGRLSRAAGVEWPRPNDGRMHREHGPEPERTPPAAASRVRSAVRVRDGWTERTQRSADGVETFLERVLNAATGHVERAYEGSTVMDEFRSAVR